MILLTLRAQASFTVLIWTRDLPVIRWTLYCCISQEPNYGLRFKSNIYVKLLVLLNKKSSAGGADLCAFDASFIIK